jgi:choline dehydrogenase-like flavoprotein
MPRFRNISEPVSDFIRGYGIWGGMQRLEVERNSDSRWFLTSVMEVLPRESGRVELDNERTDAFGIPSVRINLEYQDNEQLMKNDAIRCVTEMCGAARLDIRGMDVTLPGRYVHELGGARMGDDCRSSVLNSFNQCWDSRNLFVVDGSCFVSAGWQNPSLTIMALAARACDYVVEHMKRGEL